MEEQRSNIQSAQNNNNHHHQQNFPEFIFPFTFVFQPQQNPQQQHNHQTSNNNANNVNNVNNGNNGNNDNNVNNNGNNGNNDNNVNNGNNGNHNHIRPPLFQFFVYPMSETQRDGPFIFFTPFFMSPQEIPKNRHASEAAMKRLPIIKITQDHIDAQASCPICLDAFSFANNTDETNDTNTNTNENMDIEDTQSVETTTTTTNNNNNKEKVEGNNNKVDQATQTVEVVRQMPCQHIFCESCLFKWLKQNTTCPLCRIEIESDDKQQNIPSPPPQSQTTPSQPTEQQSLNNSNESTSSSAQNTIIDNDVIMEGTSSASSTSSDNHHSHSVTCALESVGCCSEVIQQQQQQQQQDEQQRISPMITLPQCQHQFHTNCLRTSLLVEGYSLDDDDPVYFRCPTCRVPANVKRDLLKTP